MCSVVCLSIFECKQPASVVYNVWVKCHFLFKNGTSRPSGTVNCGGTAGRSSERRFWLTWETQTVYVCGVYHWKSMNVQGVRSWTALYFVVRGHPVSLWSPLSLGESRSVSGLKMKGLELMTLFTPGFCWARSGYWLVNLTCMSLYFLSKKHLKTKML